MLYFAEKELTSWLEKHKDQNASEELKEELKEKKQIYEELKKEEGLTLFKKQLWDSKCQIKNVNNLLAELEK